MTRVIGLHSTGALVVEDASGLVWIVEADQYEPLARRGLG